MKLTREEREQIKVHIGEMLTGEPITDAELENLAEVSPAAFYVITRKVLGFMGGYSPEDVLKALPDDLLEDLQSKFRDFLEKSNPRETETWDPEILLLTEWLVLDGKGADSVTKEEKNRALNEMMSLVYIEWQKRCG